MNSLIVECLFLKPNWKLGEELSIVWDFAWFFSNTFENKGERLGPSVKSYIKYDNNTLVYTIFIVSFLFMFTLSEF